MILNTDVATKSSVGGDKKLIINFMYPNNNNNIFMHGFKINIKWIQAVYIYSNE